MELIQVLQEPVPPYALGCMPAIATIGAAPDKGLRNKLFWLLRCLGCPFTGLFYTFSIKGDVIGLSTYWLRSDQFRKPAGQQINCRPVGHHAKQIIMKNQDPVVRQLLEECIAEATILDRLSSLASAYYIFVGIFAGIFRAIHEVDSCIIEDWPYLSLALAWTLPAIYKRIFGGKLVVKDPRILLDNGKENSNNEENNNGNNNNQNTLRVFVSDDLSHSDKSHQDSLVFITFILFSTIIPWITVLLAYFTLPIGYGCRSKYLTVVCSIWTFNNTVAYISHIRGEEFVEGNRYINVWFCFSGVIMGVLLIVLALLSCTPSWWVDLFGDSCITCSDR